MRGSQYGTPVGLYRRLRAMQPVAFGALGTPVITRFAEKRTGDTLDFWFELVK